MRGAIMAQKFCAVVGHRGTARDIYRAAVLKLLQYDVEAVTEVRNLLGDMYASIVA
jgi:hypothetical protein